MKNKILKFLISISFFAITPIAFSGEAVASNNNNSASVIRSSGEYFDALDRELSLSKNLNYINFSSDEMRIIAAVTAKMSRADQIRIINKYEDYYLNIKDMSEERFIYSFTLLGGYLRDHISWPFERKYDEVLVEIMEYKFQDKRKHEFISLVLAKQYTRLINKAKPDSVNEFVERMHQINTEDIVNAIFVASLNDSKKFEEIGRLLIEGNKLQLALDYGDLVKASKYYKNNINALSRLFDSNKSIKHGDATGVDFEALTLPFFSYSLLIKDKLESDKLLIHLSNYFSLNINKLIDLKDLYIEKKFKQDSASVAFILHLWKEYARVYLQLPDEYIHNVINTKLLAITHDSFEYILPELIYSVKNNRYDSFQDAMIVLYEKLNLVKENDLSMYVHLYTLYKTFNNASPILFDKTLKDTVEYSKLYKDTFVSFANLVEFLFHNYDGHFLEKINYSYSLFEGYSTFNMNAEAYYFARSHLNLIAKLTEDTDLDPDVKLKLKEAAEYRVANIIRFFLENNYLTDASNALHLFRDVRFLNSINRSSDTNELSTLNSALPLGDDLLNKLSIIKSKSSHKSQLDSTDDKYLNDLIKSFHSDLKTFYVNTLPQRSQRNVKTNHLLPPLYSGTAVVQYFVDQKNIFILYQSNFDQFSYSIELTAEVIAHLSTLQELLSNPKSSKIKINEILSELSPLFIAPIKDALSRDRVKVIMIGRDNFTAFIPFANFFNANNALKNIDIVYLGASRAHSSSFQVTEVNSLFGASNKSSEFRDLPFVEKELQIINKLYSRHFKDRFNENSFINSSFTLKRLSDEFSSKSSVIHLSTHFSPYNEGRLLLGTGDIISTKQLWYGLRSSTNGKFVTLAACESSLSSSNAEVYSNLPNVFLNKGAHYVMAAMWKVSDEATSVFMNLFYSTLLKIGDPLTALKITKASFAGDLDNDLGLYNKALVKDIKRFSHPFFWSAFEIFTSQNIN